MLNFFNTLIEYITIFFELLRNLAKSLLNLFLVVASATTLPQTIVPYVFAPLGASILACIAFGVIKLIVGRDNL